ncbi:hypothetical protein BT63DRAFT_440932 [Microthyrium microscopicum]|uniref:Uncharacterized protein n=1 Tax=Microthyrium microscopicum TaxID=703497 RepID=A0A6A6U9C7_9PEZI|nr:hypothetical protein BT63DRAFT_440932 [Microthyrium microscopicum]
MATTAKSQFFAANSLRLTILPKPLNLAERRQIYHHLQTFGDILYFKSLHYNRTIDQPNNYLIIYRDASSATRLRQSTPKNLTIQRRPFDPVSLHWPFQTTPSNPPNPLSLSPAPKAPPRASPTNIYRSTRSLRFDVNPPEGSEAEEEAAAKKRQAIDATDVDAQTDVQVRMTSAAWRGEQRAELREWAAPYWGPFRVEGSMMQRELAMEVPLVGLSDVGGVVKRALPGPILTRRRDRERVTLGLRQMYKNALKEKKAREGVNKEVQ